MLIGKPLIRAMRSERPKVVDSLRAKLAGYRTQLDKLKG